MAPQIARSRRPIEDTPVIHPRHAARLVRQNRLDGSALMVEEFVVHDSRLQFRSLNHTPGSTINPRRPVMTDNDALLLLPLSGAQPTWRTCCRLRPSRE